LSSQIIIRKLYLGGERKLVGFTSIIGKDQQEKSSFSTLPKEKKGSNNNKEEVKGKKKDERTGQRGGEGCWHLILYLIGGNFRDRKSEPVARRV